MKKLLMILLTFAIFNSFGDKNIINAKNCVKTESISKDSQCTVDDFINSLDEFCQLVEKKDYNALLQLVVLPIPGTELVVNRYDYKGIREEEFKKNYEKIFFSEVIEKIKTRDFYLINVFEDSGKCMAIVKLLFQWDENAESMIVYKFELIDGKFKLIGQDNID